MSCSNMTGYEYMTKNFFKMSLNRQAIFKVYFGTCMTYLLNDEHQKPHIFGFSIRIITEAYEPSHEKTNNLHMQKQRRRSAVQ